MIVHLKHHQIDKTKWDNCIDVYPNGMVYAYSWYLDIMAPGWQALIDDDYKAIFPVTGFKRFGIQYIAIPIFLPQRFGQGIGCNLCRTRNAVTV